MSRKTCIVQQRAVISRVESIFDNLRLLDGRVTKDVFDTLIIQ